VAGPSGHEPVLASALVPILTEDVDHTDSGQAADNARQRAQLTNALVTDLAVVAARATLDALERNLGAPRRNGASFRQQPRLLPPPPPPRW
jgi:hypothetical protein